MMNELVLTGCDEPHFPISAMAAFGVLRLLSLQGGDTAAQSLTDEERPRLSWRSEPRWTPVLHTSLTHDEVVRALVDAAKRAVRAPIWNLSVSVAGLSPQAYRDLLRGTATVADEHLIDALACEWPVNKDGNVLLTPFYMASGRQDWRKTIREAVTLSARGDGAIEEALFGPWRYTHQLSALGWDPATERQYALEAQAPTKSEPTAVAAAVWLAAEALALFPCFSVGRRARVPGFSFATGEQSFVWPVWRSPLTHDALRALLRLPLLPVQPGMGNGVATADSQQLLARGVGALFASRRRGSTAGHGYYVFWPAELLWSS